MHIKGHRLSQHLLPPIDAGIIEAFETDACIHLPASLLSMYKWHNGCELVAGISLFPWWMFDSFEESSERYRVLTSPGDKVWDKNWFSFLSSSDISSIGVVCSSQRVMDGLIVKYDYLGETDLMFSSIESMLITLIEGYRHDVLFVGADMEVDYNEMEFRKIAMLHNPGIKMWKDINQ